MPDVARKGVESMNVEELRDLILWYEGRLKYVRFLLSELGGR